MKIRRRWRMGIALLFRVTGRTKVQSEAARLCAIRVYALVIPFTKYHGRPKHLRTLFYTYFLEYVR